MGNSQVIKINNTIDNKHIIVKLEQNVDTLEIMSLNLNSKDIYNSFNSDYGVIIGRVIANNNIGVPNAKISIFIPLNENDVNNSDIVSIYPYETPRTKNNYGKRYNLLPRVSEYEPESNEIKPKQPFGSFPTKEEVLTNTTYLEVYEKYYKFTTVTNNSGDYMIFGVPVGTQTVHMSCDITDIGEYSMTPATMVTNLGYSPNLFTDNLTKIKPSNDLTDLPNIDLQEVSVDVIPFWGDTKNFEIGITQVNFRIKATLISTFILFGSVFTDGEDEMWTSGEDYTNNRKPIELYIARNNINTPYLGTKRIGNITEKIFYYPPEISDDEITGGTTNPIEDMRLLDSSEYSVFKRDGDFVFLIPCNRKKIITLDNGDKKEVPYDYNGGIFTEFRGFVILEYDVSDVNLNINTNIGSKTHIKAIRYKLKIPQSAVIGQTFNKDDDVYTMDWRKQNYKFEYNNMYSIAKFIGTVHDNNDDDSDFSNSKGHIIDGFYDFENLNNGSIADNHHPLTRNVGMIKVNTGDDTAAIIDDFPHNIDKSSIGDLMFGGNWINFSIHLSQIGFLYDGYAYVKDLRGNTNFTYNFKDHHFFQSNTQIIAGGIPDTKWLARSDLHFTNFIKTNKTDLNKILDLNKKGFTSDEISLDGEYMNGISIENVPHKTDNTRAGGAGLINTNPNGAVDQKTYFFRGLGNADCIGFLKELKLL